MTAADIPELKTIATKMRPFAATTTIYITYDGGTRFGPAISQKRDQAGHAEHRFLQEFAGPLMRTIARRYRSGLTRTKQGDPVSIVMDITRLPCPGCTDHRIIAFVDNAKAAYPDVPIKLIINAAALTKQSSPQQTLESLIKLRKRGIEVNASSIWTEIEKKMKQYKAFDYQGRFYASWEFMEFKSRAAEVQEEIDRSIRAINAVPKGAPGEGNLG